MFGNWTTVLTTQLSEDVERVSENPAEDRGGEMGVHEDVSSVILPGENYWLKTYQFKVTDKLLLCKLFFFLFALVRANKALGDLLWGISIAGKLRSFSGDWDENISLSRNVLSQGRFVTPAAEIAQYVICRLCWLYLSWVAVFVMVVDCKQSLCQIYVSKMQYQAQASKQILVRLFGPAFWECGAVFNGLIAAQIWVVR